jgi:hypothetical protein
MARVTDLDMLYMIAAREPMADGPTLYEDVCEKIGPLNLGLFKIPADFRYGPNQLYDQIKRLEQLCLIDSHRVEFLHGSNRPRRYYHLTAAGRAACQGGKAT